MVAYWTSNVGGTFLWGSLQAKAVLEDQGKPICPAICGTHKYPCCFLWQKIQRLIPRQNWDLLDCRWRPVISTHSVHVVRIAASHARSYMASTDSWAPWREACLSILSTHVLLSRQVCFFAYVKHRGTTASRKYLSNFQCLKDARHRILCAESLHAFDPIGSWLMLTTGTSYESWILRSMR